MATIHDVARRAGVSISTVSRVLNENPRVRAETRRKVLAAIEHLGYVPNASARSLILGRSRVVALVVPDIGNPFYARLAKGVQDVCDASEVSVLICSTDRDAAKERRVCERLVRQTIDGICFVRYLVEDETLREVCRTKLPVVVIGAKPDDLPVDSVGVFGTGAALRTLLEPVVRRGRRRLAFLAGAGDSIVSRARTRIYHECVAQLRLDDDPRLIAQAEMTFEGGYAATAGLIRSGVDFDAVFALNDLMAAGAVQALKAHGRRVPEDVAVVGCDDVEIAAIVEPPLSTLRLPAYELGAQGAELLLARAKDPGAPVRERALEVRAIERASTPSYALRPE